MGTLNWNQKCSQQIGAFGLMALIFVSGCGGGSAETCPLGTKGCSCLPNGGCDLELSCTYKNWICSPLPTSIPDTGANVTPVDAANLAATDAGSGGSIAPLDAAVSVMVDARADARVVAPDSAVLVTNDAQVSSPTNASSNVLWSYKDSNLTFPVPVGFTVDFDKADGEMGRYFIYPGDHPSLPITLIELWQVTVPKSSSYKAEDRMESWISNNNGVIIGKVNTPLNSQRWASATIRVDKGDKILYRHMFTGNHDLYGNLRTFIVATALSENALQTAQADLLLRTMYSVLTSPGTIQVSSLIGDWDTLGERNLYTRVSFTAQGVFRIQLIQRASGMFVNGLFSRDSLGTYVVDGRLVFLKPMQCNYKFIGDDPSDREAGECAPDKVPLVLNILLWTEGGLVIQGLGLQFGEEDSVSSSGYKPVVE